MAEFNSWSWDAFWERVATEPDPDGEIAKWARPAWNRFAKYYREYRESRASELAALRRTGKTVLIGSGQVKAVLWRREQQLFPAPAAPKRGRPTGRRADGMKIRQLRGDFSQDDFADKCGFSLSTLKRAERSSRVDERALRRIAQYATDILGKPTSVDELSIEVGNGSERARNSVTTIF